MIKHYKTNYLKSFFIIFLVPIVALVITIPLLRDFKNSWPAILFGYPIFLFIEFLVIKYRKVEVTIDDEGIEIKRWREATKAKWSDIKRFEVSLYNWSGGLSYSLIVTDKLLFGFVVTDSRKILGFSDSLENCDDLIREIENHTGLKLKKTL